MRVENLMIAKK
jgi:hypothetical protein